MSHLKFVCVLAFMALFPQIPLNAQLSGSRGGVYRGGVQAQPQDGLAALDPEVAPAYITMEGQAEFRVTPTAIRVVLAVTAEGLTPAECATSVNTKIATLKAQWINSGVARSDIVEDFIAVLPRYEFQIEKIRDREVAVEKKVGYLMQTNVHLSVKNDAGAMEVINIAFKQGVSDIIGFDYWSKELDEMKAKARAAAVKAAREKSELLLGALFDTPPPVINVQESTRVYYPEALYESFTNSNDGEYQTSFSRRDTPQIRTFRPKNTYYRGLYLNGDVQPKELPMKSEISVVSTVRLYFKSPAATDFWSASKKPASN